MKIFRIMLFPFALLYGFITWIRNRLYISGILKSRHYDFPVICVGNLNTGGTGKSPMIEYLVSFLLPNYKVATLSRGYKRSSEGYKELSGKETAFEVGDEPLQFKKKFEKAIIAVDANRQHGIFQLQKVNKPDLVLLDDAFQHRKVKAGLNILLTAYDDLYVDDFMLPTGNLRESIRGADRAKIIVVTKCPPNLGLPEMGRIKQKLKLKNSQQLYFSFIAYGEEIVSKEKVEALHKLREKKFALVTGIANPGPLLDFLKGNGMKFKHLQFKDHHHFSTKEIAELKKESLLLTTEKDYVRLEGNFGKGQLFYLPVKAAFLKKEAEFKQEILNFVQKKGI